MYVSIVVLIKSQILAKKLKVIFLSKKNQKKENKNLLDVTMTICFFSILECITNYSLTHKC